MRAVLCLVAVVGCARSFAEAPPRAQVGSATEAARPLLGFAVPGESLEYRVALRGMTVGNVVVAVGEAGIVDERPAIIVRSRGTSGGVLSILSELRWELKTVIGLDDGSPISEEEITDATFAGKHEHDDQSRTWEAGDRELNIHAAAGALRAWRSKPGEKLAFDVSIAGAHLPVALTDAGREYLAAAKLPAVRYDGIAAEKYAVSIWISDDVSRVPLRLEAASRWGKLQVELTSYDAPNR